MEININTITNDEVKELANYIFEADNGYGQYSVQEINNILHTAGLSDSEGILLTEISISGRALEISNIISDEIG